MTLENLDAFSKMKFDEINEKQIVTIDDLLIDNELPKQERIKDFLTKVKNPYFFKCGKFIIKISYSDCDLKLSDCIHRYLQCYLDERL